MVAKISYNNIISLQEQMEKLLEEDMTLKDNPNISSLKNILKLIVNEEAFYAYYQEFNEVLLSMAEMDFTKRLAIDETGDLFSYISTAINFLNEELAVRAVPKYYLQQALDMIPETAILVNDAKIIMHVNSNIKELTGYAPSELIGQHISQIFSANYIEQQLKSDFVVNDKTVIFTKSSGFVAVKLVMQTLRDLKGKFAGYSFLIKKVGIMED